MKDNSAQKIFEQILQYSEIDNKKILEIGCGDGRITSLMSGTKADITAIDPDEDEIKKALLNISGVDFQVQSGEKTDFPDSLFDIVIFTLSLHHQNPDIALKEASRILKEDGKILVIEPLVESEVSKLYALVENENDELINASNAVEKCGLCIEKSEIFSADWVYESEEDLHHSTFNHYNTAFDAEIASQMNALFKEKLKSRPIILNDLMVISSLSK